MPLLRQRPSETMATPAATDPAMPNDVRLMNLTASVLAIIGVFALAAVALMWAARQPVFALRSIRIEGDMLRNSVATVRANAAPRLAGNFFTLDLSTARRAFESVPWVRQAVVSRIWPNRLRVKLEEHRAAALWGGDTASDQLVNSHGEVFQANPGDVEDDALPTLQGPEGSSAHMLALLLRLGPVFVSLDARVEALTLSGRGSWHAELDTGAEVELGRGGDDEVIARAQRFVSTVTQVTSRYQRPLEYADLRHNEGYAVRLKGISTTPSATDKTATK
jgi:cell division protein FtsQ